MKESKWDKYLIALVAHTKVAIKQFAAQHPDEEVCYFAFDTDPRCGYVQISFNTPRASLNFVRKQMAYKTKYRRELLADKVWFDHAYYQAKVNALQPFCHNSGDFAFPGFSEIHFPEWQQYAESDSYPQTDDDSDDYLLNRVTRLLCRATDELVDRRAFKPLRLASPTLIGISFHDQGQFVIQMLNLPKAVS